MESGPDVTLAVGDWISSFDVPYDAVVRVWAPASQVLHDAIAYRLTQNNGMWLRLQGKDSYSDCTFCWWSRTGKDARVLVVAVNVPRTEARAVAAQAAASELLCDRWAAGPPA